MYYIVNKKKDVLEKKQAKIFLKLLIQIILYKILMVIYLYILKPYEISKINKDNFTKN